MTKIGSIGDGILHLFGAGSADRGAQRDTNSAGAALDNSGNALNNVQGYINNQTGQPLNNAQSDLGFGQQSLGGESQPIADQYGQVNNEANQAGLYGNAFGQNFSNVTGANLAADGFNGPGGSYNPNFDPLGANGGSSLINQYADKTAPMYDNAVASANHDLMGRGVTGANSIAPAEIGQIRQQQASDVGNFTRQLGVQDQQEQYNRLGNAMNLIYGIGNAASQGYGNAASGYGNVAGDYGNQASGYGQNASGWDGVSGEYGNAATNEMNLGGAYGNLSTGWKNGAEAYQQQGSNQDSNLLGIAKLFPTAALGGWGGTGK